MNLNTMESLQKENSTFPDGIDPDFVWEDYLEDTHSEAAPPTAFTHVEYSLESVFKVGMKLEIPNPDDDTMYWPASVIMACGDLLTLRYVGYGDDRTADFWFNTKSGEFHPIGWCSANHKKLHPPKALLEKYPNVTALLSTELKSSKSIPAILSENLDAGFIPIDQIKCGMKLELIDKENPINVWIVTIKQNVGGRLLLQWDGSEESSDYDTWLFYLSDYLYPIGHAKSNNLEYCPPKEIREKHSAKEWDIILHNSLEEAQKLSFPSHIFEPKIPLEKHAFKEGMKLEAVNSQNYSELCPATVTKVLNDFHFLVTIDNYFDEPATESILCCNSNTPFIFPIKWAEENKLDLNPPIGYKLKNSKFSWDDYLQFCEAEAAPADFFPMCFMNMGFVTGMKLEATDPFNPNNICVATIVKIMEPLMWVDFDNAVPKQKNVIYSVNSFDIYPVGWCASNSYPLQTPVYKPKRKTCDISKEQGQIEKPTQGAIVLSSSGQQCKLWCPKIYFNHRCFTGPLLSKTRLAELPQAIGPGPLHLVIQEVIYRVVNIAYKSSRVLQILQVNGKPSPGMQQQIIKAKYKGKTNRATIEVIRNSEQVEEFCKNICQKLECCTYLFGPKHVGEICPSNCHTQTKTKFGYHFVKKKKVGRPPTNPNGISSDNGDVVKRGPGRKKKRKHWTHVNAHIEESQVPPKRSKSRDSSETDERAKGDLKEKNKSDSNEPVTPQPSRSPLIEKKNLKHITSSSIVTRGAKLPNFGLWHHVSSFHNRRGRPRTRPMRPFSPRKVGRPLGSTKKNIAAAAQLKSKPFVEDSSPQSDDASKSELPVSLSKPNLLESNPIDWTVEDVVKYLQKTDYAPLAPLLKEQEIDGPALLMLNAFNVQEYLHLKPEPAEKFCYLIKNLKIEFFTHYVS